MQDIPDSASAPQLYTETITEYTTVTLAKETSSPSLLSQYDTIARGSFYTIPRGSIRTPHSLPLPTSTSPRKTATPISTPRSVAQSTFMKVAKRSTYPRPSPPGFLYPDPIVPAGASAVSQPAPQQNMGESSVLWNSAYGLKVFLATVIVLGLAWVGLSFVITRSHRAWTCVWNGNNKIERRPLDKPSKYTHNQSVVSSGDEDVDTSLAQIPQLCLLNCTNIGYEYGGMEMKCRPRRRRIQGNLHTPTAGANTPRSISPRPSRSASTSSANPLLLPPGGTHANINTCTSSAQSAPYLSPSSPSSLNPALITNHELDTSEIEALEAGTAPLTPRTIKAHERKKSWVDLGLAKVEDTMNEMMNRAIRWGNEDDDGVILPVAHGDGRREVQVR